MSTTTANDMFVYLVGAVTISTVNVPTGFTEQFYSVSNSLTTSEMSQEIFASSGATGLIHGTLTSANSNITQLIALRPAPAPTPTPTPTPTPAPTPTPTPTPAP